MTASASKPPSLGKRPVFSLVPVVLLLLIAEVVRRRSGAAPTCPLPSYLNPFPWECDPQPRDVNAIHPTDAGHAVGGNALAPRLRRRGGWVRPRAR
jgi:hypothetical protein